MGVVLDVREITEEKYPEEYEEYYKQALAKMQDEYDENTKLSFARFYDIAFKYEDKEVTYFFEAVNGADPATFEVPAAE